MSSNQASEFNSSTSSSNQLAPQDTTDRVETNSLTEQRSSTPMLGHNLDVFRVSTSEISVISGSSNQTVSVNKRPVRRRLLESKNLEDVAQWGSSASTVYKGRQARRPDSSTKRNPNRSYELLSEEFSRVSLVGSAQPSLTRSGASSTRSLLDNSNSSSLDNEPPTKKIKQVHKGQDWNLFKPLNNDTLYCYVINEPNKIDSITDKWVDLYTQDSRRAIKDLLQFFVDVCGYQEFDMSTQFRLDDENFKEIIDWMEVNPTDTQKYTGKYLLSTYSNWSRQSQKSVFNFIVKLLEACNHDKKFLDVVMLRYVLGFLKESTSSINMAIRHTSIAIAAKIYTVFTKIQVAAQVTPSQHSTQNRTVSLSELIFSLQGQIEDNGFYEDPDLDKMKIVCIEEMWQWFRINPRLLSTTKYFRQLMDCVKVHSPKVQLAALATCFKMIETDVLSKDMAPVMKKFLDVVQGRFLDIDYKVAIASVKVLKRMLYTYPNHLLQTTRVDIMLRVYHEHVPLAMAAGEFATATFQTNSNNTSGSLIIRRIIQLSISSQGKGHISLLVESLLHCCVALTDWNLIINMLLNESFDNNKNRVLLEIMCNAAEQTLTGKSKIPRPNSPKRKISNRNVKLASDAFLSNLHRLLPKYLSDPTSMQLLVELLLYVDFEATYANKYKTEMDNVIYLLRPTFIKTTDTKLLDTISKVFARLCEETCPYRRASSVETLKGAVVEMIQKFPILEAELAQKDVLEAEARFLQLSMLFRYLDVTNLITNEVLTTWLHLEHSVTSEAKKLIITCCCWSLIWNVRTIIDKVSQAVTEDDLKQEIDSLKHNRREFINACFDFINEWKSAVIGTEAFDCICKLHLQFQNDLKNAIKCNPRFHQMLKELMPTTLEQHLQIQLINSAEKVIFEDKTESTVPWRRNSLCSIINLATLNIVNVTELFKIFKYYHSHNQAYGDIFDDYLKKLRSELSSMGIASFVLHTLLHCFENLPEEIDRNTNFMQNEAVKKLKALAVQFQLFVLRSSSEPILILKLGIQQALTTESNYGFLMIIQSFVVLLSAEEKNSILNLITVGTQEYHKYIAGFKVYLKSKMSEHPEQVKQRRRRGNTSTTASPSRMSNTSTAANTSIMMDAEQIIDNEDTDNTECIIEIEDSN